MTKKQAIKAGWTIGRILNNGHWYAKRAKRTVVADTLKSLLTQL